MLNLKSLKVKKLLVFISALCLLTIYSCSDEVDFQEEQFTDHVELVQRSNSECPGQLFKASRTSISCTTSGPCPVSGRIVRLTTTATHITKVIISAFDGTSGTDCAGNVTIPVVDGEATFCLANGVDTFHIAYQLGCEIITI